MPKRTKVVADTRLLVAREASTGGLPVFLAKPIADAATCGEPHLPPAFGGGKRRLAKGKRRKK